MHKVRIALATSAAIALVALAAACGSSSDDEDVDADAAAAAPAAEPSDAASEAAAPPTSGEVTLASGDRAASKQADTGETPVAGGTLTYAADREPTCLDPHVEGDIVQAIVARQILDSVVVQAEDGTIQPWLAESWEVAPDGLAVTFELKSGVQFTDGTPWNAEALKANLDHMVDPATHSGTAGGYLKPYERTEVVDDLTAKVILDKPYAALLEVLAQSFLGMESPTALKRGEEANCKEPIGTGPFKVESYTPQDRVVLVRNEGYSSAPPTAAHQGPAYLEKVVWRWVPEGTVRWGALRNGEVDVIDGLPPANLAEAERTDSIELLARDRPGNPFSFDLNTTGEPFNDLKVRQAFIRSADIPSALKSIYFDSFQHVGGPLTPVTTFYDPAYANVYPFDLDAANTLLDEAGWTERNGDGVRTRNGQPLTVDVPLYAVLGPEWVALHEQIQASAKKAGFDVRLNSLDLAKGTEVYQAGDYDAMAGYWITNTADVLRIKFSTEYLESAGYRPNGAFFSDPALDAVLDEALAKNDPAERKPLYAQAQKIVTDNALQLDLYPQNLRLAVDKQKVRGVAIEPALALTNLYDAWIAQ